jgi:hypothetical protein
MSLPAIIPAATAPTVAQHHDALASAAEGLRTGAKIDGYTRLLPVAVLEASRAELVQLMQPCDKTEAGKWAASLLKGYPPRKEGEADPKVYVRSLAFDLSEFPADIVERTVHEIRRSQKFLPACAEVYQHATKLMDARRRMLSVVEAQQREHERRARERRIQEAESPEQREAFLADMAKKFPNLGLGAQQGQRTRPEEPLSDDDLAERKAKLAAEMRAAGMTP